MPQLKIDNLEISMSAMLDAFAQEKQIFDMIKPRYEELKNYFDVEKIGKCIDRYITSELDFITLGNRGIGRMTEAIPRLGGYFRNVLSKMDEAVLLELYNIIRDLILRGYLVHFLFMEKEIKSTVVTGSTKLFDDWVPQIYVNDPSEMKPNLQNVFFASIDTAVAKFKNFQKAYKMKSGGFFSLDKTGSILIYYAGAGFGLRTIEIGRSQEK